MSVRVAIVGCGWWSTYAHLPAVAEDPDAELVALVDPDPARLAAAVEARGGAAQGFADLEAMLDAARPDAVIIAVPHALHHPLALAALQRGVHVLLEKPMVLDPAHGRELLAAAERSGAQLLVDYPWHYNEHVLALRAAIAGGRIGPVEHVSFLYASVVRELYRGNPEPYRDVFGYPVNAPGAGTYSDPAVSGGGQGQTQVTHAAALLFFATGLTLRRVSAFTSDFELAVDLADAVALQFDGGAIGTISSTGAVLGGQDELVRMEVVGRDGHAVLDITAGTAALHVDGGIERLPALPPERRIPEHAPAHDLVAVTAGRAGNGSPAEIGQAAVELVAAMYRSAAEGRAVAVEEL